MVEDRELDGAAKGEVETGDCNGGPSSASSSSCSSSYFESSQNGGQTMQTRSSVPLLDSNSSSRLQKRWVNGLSFFFSAYLDKRLLQLWKV